TEIKTRIQIFVTRMPSEPPVIRPV
ncbi:unnamed protein product, partial [Allacma fusca]